jgi:hypothetical protein
MENKHVVLHIIVMEHADNKLIKKKAPPLGQSRDTFRGLFVFKISNIFASYIVQIICITSFWIT